MMLAIGIIELLIVLFLVFSIYLVARILRKAGFSGLFSLLICIPIINLIAFWVLAFVEWPVERQIACNKEPKR